MLYEAETWTLRKTDAKSLEACEMWFWRRMEKISWIEKVKNEEVLRRVEEGKQILKNILKRKGNWLGHIMRSKENIIRDSLECMIEGKRGKGRRRLQVMDDLLIGNDKKTKKAAEDRRMWRRLHESQKPACGQNTK